ncbi:NDR1/HIN1-like protein [Thermus filiformis]|uniref:Lipoprotein n=1 Tax=Thermus filiformis TaxID=276 RepID=A0A0D6XBF6_THEFI|nr:LEA type 2 family protein [Thermus filiformis]KIX84666.1 hypothetical protein THFILI_03085 [Thermus filiformis]
MAPLRILPWALLLLLALLSACFLQAARPPEVALERVEVLGFSLTPEPTLRLGLGLRFQNPNPYPLPLETVGASLALEGLELPLSLRLPPGESRATLPLDLPASRALEAGRALFAGGARLQVKARLPQPVLLLDTRVGLPLRPLEAELKGVNLILKNPNPVPLKAEGRLVLLGQSLLVRADLPAQGEARLQVSGFRPGLERGRRLELELEVPGFFRYRLALEL